MRKKFYALVIFVAMLAIAGFVLYSNAVAVRTPNEYPVDVNECYDCHALIEDFHKRGSHKNINCVNCHDGLALHQKMAKELADEAPEKIAETRPSTNTDPEGCAKCHKEQFESFVTHNYGKKGIAREDKGDPKSRSPYWETLVRPYAFEIEHNEPRGHKYMLIDHLLVDRGYAGRFQAKQGWQYVVQKGSPKAWDVLFDAFPGVDEKDRMALVNAKLNREFTAPAAVSTCLLCKSSDQILAWPYMGDPSPKTSDISRTVGPVYTAKKYLRNGLPCIHCHDPHSAEPRIIRDALIDAIERGDKDPADKTIWHEGYPTKANIKIYSNKDTLGLRGHERKIAILDKYDPILQCGQCHVEYNCGVHFNYSDRKQLDFATDRRTNHFPFKTLAKVKDGKIIEETFLKHLEKWKFYDINHWVTNARLWKSQHPDAEAFADSLHAKAGATCTDCHTLGKVKSKFGTISGSGKATKVEDRVYSSHWHASPRDLDWKPCLNCHTDWTKEDAEYATNSVQNHIKSKMRKAEIWLRELVNRFQAAKDFGVDEKTLEEVRVIHEKAHMYWEWWTGEVSDGFHNPENAKVTISRAIVLARQGIDTLNKAIEAKTKGAAAAPEKK
jgi:formate-dependent nitrite reductase cytochrome c552 subunit